MMNLTSKGFVRGSTRWKEVVKYEPDFEMADRMNGTGCLICAQSTCHNRTFH